VLVHGPNGYVEQIGLILVHHLAQSVHELRHPFIRNKILLQDIRSFSRFFRYAISSYISWLRVTRQASFWLIAWFLVMHECKCGSIYFSTVHRSQRPTPPRFEKLIMNRPSALYRAGSSAGIWPLNFAFVYTCTAVSRRYVRGAMERRPNVSPMASLPSI